MMKIRLPSSRARCAAKLFRRWILQDIFIQYAALRWAGPCFNNFIWTDSKNPALVCLAQEDQIVDSEKVARHCSEDLSENIVVWCSTGAQHGSFLYDGFQRCALCSRVENYLQSV